MNLFHLPSTFKAQQRKDSKIHGFHKIPSDSAKSGDSLPKPASLHFPPESVLGWQILTTVISRPAYGWGHWPWSAHEHVCGRSPYIWQPAFPLICDPSFPQNRAVPLYCPFFLSLPHYWSLLITFSIISIYSGTDCKAWCHCKILLDSSPLEKTDRGGKTGQTMTVREPEK